MTATNDVFGAAIAFIGGFFLGVVFYGGLWWTTRKALSVRRPAVLVAGSFFLRIAVVSAGFLIISAMQWQRLLMSLAGLLIARLMFTLGIKTWGRRRMNAATEGSHETQP